MDSTASHKWLAAELENDEEVVELDHIDALTMQQLADELWDQPPIHHQEHEQQQLQQVEVFDSMQQQRPDMDTAYTTGFPLFHGGGDMSRGSYAEGFLPVPTAIGAVGDDNSLFSFTGGGKSSEQLMSFGASREPKHKESKGDGGGTTAAPPEGSSSSSSKGGRPRVSSGVQEHVVAERKRREKMNHQFATLASIIPDITKTDKVSLLGSTIDYVHHLNGRLKALQAEQQSSTAESPALDARCCVGGSLDDHGAAKIEAEVRGRTVLLRVVCREKKGVLIMLLKELEKHGLSTINTNVLLLAGSSLNITVTAQIEDGFSTAAELVDNLNAALKKF